MWLVFLSYGAPIVITDKFFCRIGKKKQVGIFYSAKKVGKKTDYSVHFYKSLKHFLVLPRWIYNPRILYPRFIFG